MLIDTHAHLNFNAYKDDADEVIRRSLINNVWMINVGSNYSTSQRAVEIAEKYKQGVYSAVGLHPIHSQDGFNYSKYKELAQSLKTIAIGEIGLDYKEEYISFKEKQKEVFFKQLELARELNLPIIFHCRMAHNEIIEILKNEILNNKVKLKGVIHCFTGTLEQAKKYLEMGFHLGLNGIIFSAKGGPTSGGKLNLYEIIKKISLDKILIETDCPYLTPPLPTELGIITGRNEPIYVKYIAKEIAKIKNISYEEVIKKTTENAKNLFNI